MSGTENERPTRKFTLTPEQILDLITRKAMDAFIVSDVENTVVVWTAYAETLFGWTAKEAVGRLLTELIIPPEHRAAHEEGIRRFLETGELRNVNKRLETFGVHKDGHLLPLELTVIPVQLGEEILFSSSIRDNSERYRHQQTLQYQAALLNLSRDAIIVTNAQDEIEFWSSGAATVFDYPAAEALGRRYHELLGTSYSLAPEQVTEVLHATGHWEGEVICRTKGEATISVLSRYALERDRNGEACRILISNTDISLRKEIQIHETLLAESEQRFNAVFEHHPDGVIHFNRGRRLTSANEAFVQLSGYSHAEVLSVNRPFLIPPEHMEALIAAVDAALDGTPQSLETVLVHKNGSRLEVSATLIPNVADGQIIGVHGVVKDNSVSKNHERQIHFLATHDSLTGLPNRYFLEDRLGHAIEHAKRVAGMVGVLFLDLNRFKLINDSLGHDKGDLLLGVVAERLKGAVREVDTVARLGGDEFVVVLENIHDPDHVCNVARHILESIAKPVHVAGHMLSVTTSIGSSFYPTGGEDPATLLRHADLAMYEAKAAGHGIYKEFHAGMGTRASSRLLQETALRHALEADELVLHYQPRIRLATGTIARVEALVRWNHPHHGLVMPGHFIALAEEIGCIEALGAWVLKAACRQLSAWHRAGLALATISINVSALQLRSTRFYDTLIEALAEAAFDASALELEITETAFMQNVDQARETLNNIGSLGVKLSVDDFGTGYSSLSQLKALPVDSLKIDQSFMENLLEENDDATIVSATIAMAQKMGLTVVAEGVSTVEQLRFLEANHCDEAQGYLFSYPCPAHEFEPFLRAHLSTAVANFKGATGSPGMH
jgi:diguanylate cyclase (GGDEF)-like protein/PAS domain S-box-containing protein